MADHATNEQTDVALSPPPARQEPTEPMYGYFADDPRRWLEMHESFVERARRGDARIVFLGDSITQGWDPTLWAQRFAPLGAVNFGIGGDRTQQLLWRIDHGTLDGLAPDLFVLMIGVNNLWDGLFDAAQIAGGIEKVVAAIRGKCPAAKVLLIGVLPTQQDPGHELRAKVRDINAIIARLDDGLSVRYEDLGKLFLQPDGTISPEIMPDYLHLTPAGYRIFADAIEPMIYEMLPCG